MNFSRFSGLQFWQLDLHVTHMIGEIKMREWIGNYTFHYSEYHSYKDEWINRTAFLGHCGGIAEAAQKAVSFMNEQEYQIKPLYLKDGFGRTFKA